MLGRRLHHRDEFIVGERAAFALKRGGEGARGKAQDKVERREDRAPEPQESGAERRNLLRVPKGETLRRDLSEEEEQQGHHRKREKSAAVEAEVVEKTVADGRDDEVDERVSHEQRGEQHRLVGEAAGDPRIGLRAALPDARALRAGERKEHGLGSGEERREDKQRQQGQQLDHARTPIPPPSCRRQGFRRCSGSRRARARRR